jgi:ATP-dependent DNA helicase RecG
MNPEDKLETLFRLAPKTVQALQKLGLKTTLDLLHHFPTRYIDTAEVVTIESLKSGDNSTVFGKISNLKTSRAFRKKIPMAEATITDESGSIKVVWFHQAYLAKMIQDGSHVRVEGRVSTRNGNLYFSNPKIEQVTTLFTEATTSGLLHPIYPESRGVTSNWIYHKIQTLFSSGILNNLKDPIPESILKTYKLPDLRTSLLWIHSPKKRAHTEAARKRFAFEEIFFIQLERQQARHETSERVAYIIDKKFSEIEKFIKLLPFEITRAQLKSTKDILTDFHRGHPMSRLLEGDVGSGKTAVAAIAIYSVVTTRPEGQDFGVLQVAYMAPTEILAQQHFESFVKYFSHLPINMALLTSSGCRKFPSKVNSAKSTEISRSQLLKWVSSGEISVLVGTHALIQKSVKFKHLAFVIIDEQHRFGTVQRQQLIRKDVNIPHLLSMTATPIPRTLALTLYSDLDLSLLDEMPLGRKKIITEIVLHDMRAEVYKKIRYELGMGRQLYVICPRIDEPDPDKELAIQAKSVKAEAKRLKEEIFPEYEIGILHSKMKSIEKEKAMLEFKEGRIEILVATSVIEVGVNVENASLIIIEGAERFGLAQLHQLRGRILRGTHQPYCFVFSDSRSAKTLERLDALKTAKNGFELAELDLAQRGAGELGGTKQWGISDLGMEAIKNIKMVEVARNEALKIIKEDPKLTNFPLLKNYLEITNRDIHFE